MTDVELLIGRVVKAHGIRGEVAVEVTTEDPDRRFAPGEVLTGRLRGNDRPLTVAVARPHQGRLLVTFDEVPDRTAAEGMRGMKFFAAPLDDDGEDDGFYDHELVGLRVLHEGTDIGEVTGVTHTVNRAILDVSLTAGGEAMVPFVEDIVPEVDLETGTLTITPPDGLLDL